MSCGAAYRNRTVTYSLRDNRQADPLEARSGSEQEEHQLVPALAGWDQRPLAAICHSKCHSLLALNPSAAPR